MKKYDVIILGLGGMGSCAANELSRRGLSCLGIEQFSPAHDRGSSHGERRMIRQAYFEHPDYVPLLKKAYKLWDRLETESADKFFYRSGLLLAGPGKGKVLQGALTAAKIHGIKADFLSHADMSREFPLFRFPEHFDGVFEPDAGFLEIEKAILAAQKTAPAQKADLHFGERAVSWRADSDGVQVVTDKTSYSAEKLIVAAGPWSSRILSDLQIPLKVKRVPQFWFESPPAFEKDRAFPCFGVDMPESFYYGFPPHAGLLKSADHTPKGDVADPLKVDRELHDTDFQPLVKCLQTCLPGLSEGLPAGSSLRPKKYSVCMYTMTPDEHFVIDRHPRFSRVSFAAGFSGHGYKFASVVGSILADLAIDGKTEEPAAFLKLRW